MSAGGSAVSAGCDVDAALGNDDWIAEVIETDTPCQRLYTIPQSIIALAGGAEAGGILRVHRSVERFLQSTFRSSRFLLQKFHKLGFPVGQKFLQLGQRNFWLLVTSSRQAEERLSRTLGGVVQQTFVNVADLFDVERPETEPTSFR